MASRATRSASRKARLTGAVATGPLGALSHDELGVIFDGLADPLQPVIAVALSSACLGLRTPLRAALEVLQERHALAVALCLKTSRRRETATYLPKSCVELRETNTLIWITKKLHTGLNYNDMATLGMILCTNRLPKLIRLYLTFSGDTALQLMCGDLCRGAAPSLRTLDLDNNETGLAGTVALANALCRGAMPVLECLSLSNNRFGNEGVAALAPTLRKLPSLRELDLCGSGIGDEGVASLVDNLGKDDFKELTRINLEANNITAAGFLKLAATIDAGGLPKLVALECMFNEADPETDLQSGSALQSAIEAVWDAVRAAVAKRAQ